MRSRSCGLRWTRQPFLDRRLSLHKNWSSDTNSREHDVQRRGEEEESGQDNVDTIEAAVSTMKYSHLGWAMLSNEMALVHATHM